jgi:GTP-binding protein Era
VRSEGPSRTRPFRSARAGAGAGVRTRRRERRGSAELPPARAVRSGFVTVAGRPNVGKSTLVNALCGGKVAIVSDKPQTTRRRILGIANGDGHQLVLADLPGFQRPRDPLTEHMQRTVERALEDVDALLFVLSARERIGAGDRFIARRVFALGVPVVIALNKVDRLKPAHIATQMATAARLGDFHALHPVSAKTGDGVAELRDELVGLLPEGPRYFSEEVRTDLDPEDQVAELIREKAIALTREEVPHAITVDVETIDERSVRADVLVETESQKQILVGRGGSMVKEIGVRARPEIEQLLGRHVYLELRVKVRPRWRLDEGLLERLGL